MFNKDFVLKLVYSFVRAFVGAFIVGIAGIAAVPNLSAAKALVVAAAVGALTAAVRAVQHVIIDVPAAKKKAA